MEGMMWWERNDNNAEGMTKFILKKKISNVLLLDLLPPLDHKEAILAIQ